VFLHLQLVSEQGMLLCLSPNSETIKKSSGKTCLAKNQAILVLVMVLIPMLVITTSIRNLKNQQIDLLSSMVILQVSPS
jgi:hypothetical protein